MHQVDLPTLAYAKERFPDIIAWNPLLHGENGRPFFNTSQFMRRDGTYVSVFSIKPVYYEALGGFWRPISEITEYHGNRKMVLNKNWRMATPRFIDWLTKRQALFGEQLLLPTPFGKLLRQDIARPTVTIGLTTTTVYPDPNPETTTIDGLVQYSNAADTWTSTRDKATASLVQEVTDLQMGQAEWCAVCGSRYIITRNVLKFDTASIPDSDVISAATLSVYPSAKDATNSDSLEIVTATTAANTSLTAADYAKANWGTTSFGSLTLSALSTGAYNDITLNGSGIAAISKTAVSHFGERSGNDLNNTTPTQRGYSIEYSADAAGTSTDPKLTVTHAGGGGAQNSNFLVFL